MRNAAGRTLIEIPGYKILRQLGRGGMATVYLAVQESVQREVALKVMSPALLADPDFSERFLREARIAASLHHRHVVGIHDVARSGDYNYIAMEYLGGGAVLPRDGSTRPPTFALRVTREIAQALNYAHAKGVVHRDIKPDNILLREDGSSALTDFGIARAADSATRMTRTGAVIGTPHYMSPEQARGKTVDGRADLYSLGIVLYEMLVGRVPYTAEDSLAVGIMHVNEPVPVLPVRFNALQPLVDRMLAKNPDDRFDDGAQLAEAIERMEHAIANGAHPELESGRDETAQRIGDIDLGDEIRISVTPRPSAHAAVNTPARDVQHRIDPALGRLDDLGETGTYRAIGRNTGRPGKRPRSGGGWVGPIAVVLGLAVLGGAAWHWQDRLRALVPNTQLNDTIARAQQALAAGKLLGPDGARELFQQVRAQDADNDEAREGLNQVGQRLLDDARAALQKRDLGTARDDLAAAGDVLGGGDEVAAVQREFDAAQARGTQVDKLLASADAALAAGKLLGNDGAAALYRKILAVDADNAVARSGLDKVAAAQAQRAREALNQGDVDAAAQRIDELAQLQPEHAAIPQLRAGLEQKRAAVAKEQQEQEQQRAAAEQKQERAVAVQRQGTAPRRDAQPSAAPAQGASVQEQEPQELSLADRARIDEMLGEADRALAAGNLMDPGGAYDKYRAVLAIDGDNVQAMGGLKRIAPRARMLFDQAVNAGKPNAAQGYLDAIADTDPDNPAVIGLRIRLANVYLDAADRYADQGRRRDAQHAFDAASKLSPINPRSAAVEAKIDSLPAGG
jgi:serine/threonine-protein kinase PpkA